MDHFEIVRSDRDTAARRGVLRTAHGPVDTPAFMPVGTAGTVKGITPEQLKATGAGMILANTYHLLLRPGIDAVERLGGLHRFMAWDRPILTDSGGYQVFSLGRLTRISDDGVEFASHIDGARVYLNAEIAAEVQNRLGADVIMCFDECPAHAVEMGELEKAVERTVRWAERSKKAHTNRKQLLFGIVQGGTNPALRQRCAKELVALDFDGYAIGGLSVGEAYEQMVRTVSETAARLPVDKPRYLMGVGTPADIVAAVRAGVDMFDCVLPTRNGRNAFAFTEAGAVRMRNSEHIEANEPIESGCDCYCCTSFTRGAIRHFFNSGEMLGPILLSLHNLRFYQRLMTAIRASLAAGSFGEWSAERLLRYRELWAVRPKESGFSIDNRQ